jgi:glycosyltransferase involved in cell wall biosynthesis
LIRAWIGAGAKQSIDLPLKIVGTGPMEPETRALSGSSRVPIEFLGPFQRQDVRRILTNARFLVCPSEWEEPMGLVAIEAMAVGVPVLASRRGGLAELIVDGTNGFLFAPGDESDLIRSARRLEDVATNLRMGREARNSYLARYTPEQNYAQLMSVYRHVESRRSCGECVGR